MRASLVLLFLTGCLAIKRVPLYRMKTARRTLEVINLTATSQPFIKAPLISFAGNGFFSLRHCPKMADWQEGLSRRATWELPRRKRMLFLFIHYRASIWVISPAELLTSIKTSCIGILYSRLNITAPLSWALLASLSMLSSTPAPATSGCPLLPGKYRNNKTK